MKKLLKCEITIRTASGIIEPYTYTGVFKSTIAATMDALAKVNEPPYIKVTVLK